MTPLADVIAGLRRIQPEIGSSLARAVGTLMEENAAMSKAMIGQELPIWPPLAPSTIAEKERLWYTNRVSPTDPLLREGTMRESLQAVVHIEPEGLTGEVGTDVPYARVQEMGDAHVPPRPFISPPFITMEPRAAALLGDLAVDLLKWGGR